MDEIITTTTEQTADQSNSFLEGWGDDPSEAEQAADQQTGQEEEQQSDGETGAEAADDTAAEGAAEGDAGAEAETKAEVAADQTGVPEQQNAAPEWTVKHMDQTRTMTAGDVTPELLQKGLDYDRIRTKYDEAKPVMEMFGQFAAQAGMSIPDYVKFIRTETKKAGGMSEAEAKKTVELEDREAAVSAKEAQQQAAAKESEDNKARIQADLTEFAKAFPTVYEQAKSDPKAIPASVWNDVNTGLSLTAAYARYAVAQAEQAARAADSRAATAAQNQTNAARATGSMKSAGNDAKKKAAFLEGWDS